MTVFEYLQQLPQDLFEATLMGLMNVPFDPMQEAQFNMWMNSPHEEYFDAYNPFDPRSIQGLANEDAIALFGRKIQKLPSDKQSQLKDAIKSYCEVCDHINQSLANARKDVSSNGCTQRFST